MSTWLFELARTAYFFWRTIGYVKQRSRMLLLTRQANAHTAKKIRGNICKHLCIQAYLEIMSGNSRHQCSQKDKLSSIKSHAILPISGQRCSPSKELSDGKLQQKLSSHTYIQTYIQTLYVITCKRSLQSYIHKQVHTLYNTIQYKSNLWHVQGHIEMWIWGVDC